MRTKLILLGLLLVTLGYSQTIQPATGVAKCYIPFYFTATGAHAPMNTGVVGYDNRQDGCANWILYYSNIGFSAVSLLVESAPAAASNAPGTYVTFAGTTVTGSNPSTTTTQCGIGCFSSTGYYPWVRLTATLTGSGAVVGVLLGDPTPVSSISPPPPPVGTQDVNLKQVGGVTTPVGNGVTGTGSQRVTIASDNTAFSVNNTPTASSTALVDGVSNTANLPTIGSTAGVDRNFPFKYNGSTWDRDFNCTNQAVFNLSGSGDTQIIAASGSTTIRICHLSFSTTATEDIKITRGTGSNCGTGTNDVTGLYKSVQSAVFNFTSNNPLKGAASGAICLNQSAVQALGGIVIYAQY